MTTKMLTGLLSKTEDHGRLAKLTSGERLFQLAFGAVQWPWLLKSLYGGTQAEKKDLLERLGLDQNSLPHLGSWKADTFLLHRLVDAVETLRPANVVELGSGASSLILAKALAMNGGGMLHSYDQYLPFVAEMQKWLGEHGLEAAFHHAPLTERHKVWPGLWYDLSHLPGKIDLLVIDGPPWSVHPFARGMAECLFERVVPGGLVMLDDAARPGERIVARRWRRNWPQFEFTYDGRGSKGLLVGRKRCIGGKAIAE